MAKRGRKPAKRRAVAAAGEIPRGWEPPEHLTGDAESAWRHVVGLLLAAGDLDRTDPVLVETYAINVAVLREAHKAVEQDGVTTINGMGALTTHPALSTINSASMRLKSIAEALRLTPSTSKLAGGENLSSDQGAKWTGILGVIG